MPTYTFTDLDDERCLPDASASTFVPEMVLANQRYLRENRHVGASVKCGGGVFSTHPKAWWGVPILVPTYPGCESLNVTIAVAAFDEDGLVRLSVNGTSGTPVAVTADAGEQFVNLSVPLFGTGDNVRATLEFQSAIVSGSGVSLSLSSGLIDRNNVSGGFSGVSYGVIHRAFRMESNYSEEDREQWHEGYRYAGQVTMFGLRVWPAVEVTQFARNGDAIGTKPTIYTLTQFRLYGYTWWLDGDDVTDLVPPETIRPGQPIYAQGLQRLHLATQGILRQRVHVLSQNLPNGVSARQNFAGSAGYSPRVVGVTGYRACGLLVPLPFSRSLTWQTAEDNTSSAAEPTDPPAYTAVASGPEIPANEANARSRRRAEDPGTLPLFSFSNNGFGWGARDLIHCAPGGNDVDRLTEYNAEIGINDDDGNRIFEDYVAAAVGQGYSAPTYSPQIREVRNGINYLEGSTAIAPGEIIRGNTQPSIGGPRGPGQLAVDVRNARSRCQRMLVNLPRPSSAQSGGTSDTETYYGITPFRTSPESSRFLDIQLVGMNVTAHVNFYDTSGTLLVTEDFAVGNASSYDSVFTSADLSATLASDTTYYITITGECTATPSGLTQFGQMAAARIYEI